VDRKEKKMLDPHLWDKRFVEKRHYDVKQLWDSHHEIVRRIALGENNQQVAEAMGITPQTVSNIRNSPLAREKVEELKGSMDEKVKQIFERIQGLQHLALDTLEKVITGQMDEDPMPALKTKAATTVLAMGGNGPIQKAQTQNLHITRNELEVIKERARSAAQAQGVIVAEYEEVPT